MTRIREEEERSYSTPGRLTVLGRVNHLGAEPANPSLLSLSHPSMGKCNEYPEKLGE